MKKTLGLAALIGLIILVYVWGTLRQSNLVNTDMEATDQSAYMDYAKSMAQSNWQFVGGRNRMPAYPAFMSIFYEQGISDESFFIRGKTIGIFNSLLVLSVAFLIFRQNATMIDALTGTLVAMFTVLAYKAPYFQAEVLFYGINLLLYFLLLALIQKPQIRTAALAGFVGGIGHLTKASVLPAILLAALLLVLRGALGSKSQQHTTNISGNSTSRTRFVLNHVSYMSVLIVCYLLVIFPYIHTSKVRFGHYFYNVNSTFYMWYDSWDEVEAGTKAYGDRQNWPEMPEEAIPSLQNYVRNHSIFEILYRFIHGFLVLGYKTLWSYGYGEFVMIYIIVLTAFFVQNKTITLPFLRSTNLAVPLFVVGYFLGYTILYAWYTPIASGNRFILSLFLPAMYMIMRGLSFIQDHKMSLNLMGRKMSASRVSPTILLLLIAYVLTVYPYLISNLYGGE